MKEGYVYKIKYRGNRGYTGCQNPPYPMWDEMYIPVKCIAVYPTFVVVETLPHTQKGVFGTAEPYRVTLDLFGLETYFAVKEGYGA